MITSSFLFYDTETTGLNPCFDQALQFAAIRADNTLSALETHDIQIKLNPEILPAPEALLTHGMSINECQRGIVEIDAALEIHQLLNAPGTISIGYNTLNFDDELLRFTFYRNLLTPYTHQYANQCSRADIYPITILYYLFQPDILEWPFINDKVSFKLENIMQANKLTAGEAHHALTDVKATLALAKILAARTDSWHYALGYFNKSQDGKRIHQLTTGITHDNLPLREALMLRGQFGSKNNFLAPVLHLGSHNHYKNQTLWLRLDSPELSQTTADNIAEKTFVIRKKLGEAEFILPTHDRYLQKISTDRQSLVTSNKAWLSKHPSIVRDIIFYYQNYCYQRPQFLDADAALYDNGFPTLDEQALMNQFHNGNTSDKLTLAMQFNDTSHRELAWRIMGRHYFDALSTNDQQAFKEFLIDTDNNQQRPEDYRGQPRPTLDAVLSHCRHLLTTQILKPSAKQLLRDYISFLEKRKLQHVNTI